jgi:hypothetical protein
MYLQKRSIQVLNYVELVKINILYIFAIFLQQNI